MQMLSNVIKLWQLYTLECTTAMEECQSVL